MSGIEEDYPHLARVAHGGNVTTYPDQRFHEQVAFTAEIKRALAELQALRTNVANLTTFKYEACLVIEEWDEVYKALGEPGPLGRSMATNSLRGVRDLHHRIGVLEAQLAVQRRIPR